MGSSKIFILIDWKVGLLGNVVKFYVSTHESLIEI